MAKKLNLRKKIELIMTCNESFDACLEFLLYVISISYTGIINIRAWLYKHNILKTKELPCKVVSIGNITVGGTGKTPMTIYLANLLQDFGYRPVVISRGYGGSKEKSGGIVSNGKSILMGPDSAGDEPYLMAVKLKNTPVLIGKNRFEIGKSAIKEFNPDVIILDDAFQHIQLKRDLNIVLLDSAAPFGNNYLIPRGILREPTSRLKNADIFIMTRYDRPDYLFNLIKIKNTARNCPIFKCRHVPDELSRLGSKGEKIISNSDLLKDRKIFAFSGIAKNEDFKRVINSLKCDILNFLTFSDHHSYSDSDLKTILKEARKLKADCLVTTEKDYVKIADKIKWPVEVFALGIKISFGNDELHFRNIIKKRLLY
ncbi:Tetraacyldisaccharide 4'-kinase [Candidatus Magnetomoraceae bacterium gMMP-15]